jgi:hypothetical protein
MHCFMVDSQPETIAAFARAREPVMSKPRVPCNRFCLKEGGDTDSALPLCVIPGGLCKGR